MYAPSLKERDLWVNCLINLLGVKRMRCSSESQYEDESDDNELQLRYIRMQQDEVQDQIDENKRRQQKLADERLKLA